MKKCIYCKKEAIRGVGIGDALGNSITYWVCDKHLKEKGLKNIQKEIRKEIEKRKR